MVWWEKYIGIPFAEKGRDLSGVDCWGLVRLVYKEQLGIDLPSYDREYADSNDREVLARLVNAEEEKLWHHPEKPQPFDVIIINMLGMPTHVGIVIDSSKMLHCLKGADTVCERFNGLKWSKKVQGFARWNS